MRISTIFFTIKQGIINIYRNKTFSLASIATIGACIFLFGLFYSIVINFQHIVKEAQSGMAVTVFFDDGISNESVQAIGEQIGKRAEVSDMKYVTDDEAWEGFKEEYLGEFADGFADGMEDDNPLVGMGNYEIYINDVAMQKSLVTYIESIDGVREVRRSDVTAEMLSNVNILIGYVSVGIIIILLAVSVFLISNTVTIGIAVRKEEIAIMKLIGATDFVVRSPFVIEGIIIGLIGSALPLGAVYYIYVNVIGYAADSFNVLKGILQFLPVTEIFSTLAPISMIIGVGIGFFGSIFTVRKHLRV